MPAGEVFAVKEADQTLGRAVDDLSFGAAPEAEAMTMLMTRTVRSRLCIMSISLNVIYGIQNLRPLETKSRPNSIIGGVRAEINSPDKVALA